MCHRDEEHKTIVVNFITSSTNEDRHVHLTFVTILVSGKKFTAIIKYLLEQMFSTPSHTSYFGHLAECQTITCIAIFKKGGKKIAKNGGDATF